MDSMRRINYYASQKNYKGDLIKYPLTTRQTKRLGKKFRRWLGSLNK